MKRTILLIISLLLLVYNSVMPVSASDNATKPLADWGSRQELFDFLASDNTDSVDIYPVSSDNTIGGRPIEKAIILSRNAEKVGKRINVVLLTRQDRWKFYGTIDPLPTHSYEVICGAIVDTDRYGLQYYYIIPSNDNLFLTADQSDKLRPGLWHGYYNPQRVYDLYKTRNEDME